MTTEKTRQAGQQAAQTARRSQLQQRKQNEAQQTAIDIREHIDQISPQAAQSMGAPMDPTKGYSFEPDARPNDLPMPGDAPGGTAERRVGPGIFQGQTMADAMKAHQEGGFPGDLPDDHDELVGAGLGGPAPRRQPEIRKGPPKNEHPVLSQLRQDLGLEPIHPKDVSVGGHKWTMVPLSPGDIALVLRLVDQLGDTPGERLQVYNTAVAAHAIVAIDGVPTYQVFGVEGPPGVPIVNHLRPPKIVKFLSAARLFDFINDESRTQLNEKLHDAYMDSCNQYSAVESYLDNPEKKRFRFRCPEENCGHELFIRPRFIPGTRDLQLPFCQWHGCPMDLVGKQEESPSPL